MNAPSTPMPRLSIEESGVPRFSVLITSYRSLRFLPDCLGSVLGATGPTFEVIFLDNGSPEPEAEWLLENIRDPRLRVFKEPETRFFAGGMSFLTKHARGEFIVMLNSDTRVEPDWLQVLDDYLRDTGFEAAQADLRDAPTPDLSYPLAYNIDLMGMNIDAIPGPRGRIFCACGAAFAVRRDVYFEIGGLDESFRMYYEDLDLCWRLNLAGYRVGYAAGAKVIHIGGGSGRKAFFSWVLFRNIRNRQLCFVKNAGLSVLMQFFALNILLRLGRLPFNLLTGQWGRACAEVAATASFLWMMPGRLADRKAIQAGRVVRDEELLRRGYIVRRMKYLVKLIALVRAPKEPELPDTWSKP
jgi:GT2 family glycosyltransferase